jgi:undecaprenyl-phosphate galactose phosphotransferase
MTSCAAGPFVSLLPGFTFEKVILQRGPMGKLEAQIQSEYDYAGMAFEGSVFVSEASHSKLPLLSTGTHIRSWRYQHVKRWIDIAGSICMIAVSLIPGLLIAATIALTSEGPIFYRETRIGRGGRSFLIWKFRSMCTAARWQEVVKAGCSDGIFMHWRVHKNLRDPRITRVGGFLRRWSLDELPQVLNVLRGEMSLVGPRPVVAAEVPLYGHLQHFYLAARPGLSGLWQVSGRSNLSFAARANLDASYVRNWSLLSDFGILFRTIPAVLGRVGAR